MEILNKFKQNGYFTAELYHLLAKKKLVDPSEAVINNITYFHRIGENDEVYSARPRTYLNLPT